VRRLIATLLLCLALCVTALADGVMVPQAVVVKPARTPDQKALLRFDGATETLVIETTVQGEGREFAWILPLPAPPGIEASTTGLFPTLAALTAPTVEEGGKHKSRSSWAVVVALGLGLWISVRWWRRPLHPAVAVCTTPLLLIASCQWIGGGCGTETLKSAGGADSVTVLSRAQVGAFDTATLDARDAAGLRAWLEANGFRAPEGIDAVADAYAKEGWVFVASKVRRDADDAETRRVHPLAFTFPSQRAVYPMRLTGSANDSVALELFVAGDRRAEADGMTVEYCHEHGFQQPGSGRTGSEIEFARFDDCDDVSDEVLRRCGGASVLTKLTGVFDRAAMAHDLDVRWTAFARKEVLFLTPGQAFRHALLSGAQVLAAALVVAAIFGRRRALAAGVRATRLDFALIGAALCVAAGTTYIAWRNAPLLPGESRVVSHAGRGLEHRLKDPPRAIRGDAAAIRNWASAATQGAVNAWTGEPAREEDSPGNWSLRESDGRIELVLHALLPWGGRAIDLSRLASIGGVVRAADGRNVAGASVRLTDTYWRPAPSEFFLYTVRTDTDANGRWHLDIPVGRRWHVSVVHADHPYLLREDADLRDPPTAPMDLVLPHERTIRGRVVDATGRPVAGATVMANRETPFETHDSTQSASTTSGADGTFELTGFDADAASVRVSLHVHRGDHCRGEGSRSVVLGKDSPPIELNADAK
jgi:hypothetical protein